MRKTAPILGIIGSLLLTVGLWLGDWAVWLLSDMRDVSMGAFIMGLLRTAPFLSLSLIAIAILGLTVRPVAQSAYVTTFYTVGWVLIVTGFVAIFTLDIAVIILAGACLLGIIFLGFGRLIYAVERLQYRT